MTQPVEQPSNPWTAALVLIGIAAALIGGIVIVATYDGLVDPGMTGGRLAGILLVFFGMLNIVGYLIASAVTWQPSRQRANS